MNKKQHISTNNEPSNEVSITAYRECVMCKHSYLIGCGNSNIELRCIYNNNTSSVCRRYAEREHFITVEAEPTPMHLKYTTGCMADSLTVDGCEEIDLTDEQRREAWQKLCHWLAGQDGGHLNELLQFVLPWYGTYSSDSKPCECCGDWVETYEVTID